MGTVIYERLGFESFEDMTSGLYPYENELICKWDKIPIAMFVSIYYKPYQDGFCAYVYDNQNNRTVFTLRALFDGVRHLYMGDSRDINYDDSEKILIGDYGYIYYAKPLLIAKIFEMINELVEKFCQKGSYEL